MIRKNPYVRFVHEQEPPVICQGGQFYSDGGERLKGPDIPDWVWKQASLMTKQGRDKVGLKLPNEEEPAPRKRYAQKSGESSGAETAQSEGS